MRKVIQFSLNNKLAIWILTIIVAVAGLYSGMNMKLETIPNINVPFISVSTVYPGATPEEVAKKVTEPIEQRVEHLDGVTVVRSSSFQHASFVQIEYEFDKDMEKAQNEVKEALSHLKLPDGAQEPDVSRISFSAFPVISLSVTNPDESLAELTETVERHVVPELEGIDGVDSVEVAGQQMQEVNIRFDEQKLKQYGLTEQSVINVIQASAVSLPLGLYTFGDTEKSVVIDGRIVTVDDLKALRIPIAPANGAAQSPMAGGEGMGAAGQMQGMAAGQGAAAQTQGAASGQAGTSPSIPSVSLSDLAEVEVVAKAESISRTNGEPSIGVQIVKAQDANTVTVVNAVKEKIKDLEKRYDGLRIITVFDQGQPIEDSVNTMVDKAVFGALFAVIVIFLFLRNIRTTLISVVSIPLSLLIAILLLYEMDITLNLMTLGAMTVAIGRVIDDSIVVVENIYRRMTLPDEPLTGKELIVSATKEMFIPIASSTIVTVAVFLPLGLVKGMVGELFLPFALTIVFALLASLIVAVTVVPALAHWLFRNGVAAKRVRAKERKSLLASWYKTVLRWSLDHKLIVSGAAVLLLVASLFLVPYVGVSFLPSDEQKMIVATYSPAPGQTVDQVERIAKEVEAFFEKRDGVKNIQLSVGGGNPMNPGQDNAALFYVEYDPDVKNFAEEKEKVMKALDERGDKGEWQSQDVSGTGTSNVIELNVYGDQMEEIEPIVEKVADILRDHDELTNVKTSMSARFEEYTLVADQKKLSEFGLTVAQIAAALSENGERQAIATVKQDGEDLNVYIATEKEQYDDIRDLMKKTIVSPIGIQVLIEDVAELKKGHTYSEVQRYDGRVYASVSAEVKTKDVAAVSADVQKAIDKLRVPSNVDVHMGGVTEDIEEAFTQLGLAMLAAVAIVYFVLVVTFGGGLAPFTILFSLPFTVIGALLALFIADETISISALIGMLMLIGIVVTNAIVLIDRVIHKERDGLSTREALLEAAGTRLRPILMTAIATVGALLPLAFGMEGGALISKGLGVTVIGGLTSSTLLTLIIVPIVYETLMKWKKKGASASE
ncbi:efflux RND transporter permease subunit [Geobacillus stearothermophilus]|uniref:efflux RND transporter permease subunit n=1 Tax=Geobacillus stearothermophilus TaxID=1422 RepID=UPI0025A623EC|nr:efflux RND transporter permease subunit [Geobacillus stearothermophilus]MED4268929.1 efflux RND transporter permease subunit [Geobacillus stearothermophilus]WJP99933.1 efflux RND transporter permease subunit [Geobacillus stearothermophilus]WJQ03308.1 efflux RND transporter permease subunit [Geobacillus stearothermophilus]WJQ06657.1 efflux RND transporter permease subunit [Geobacillus stearothermophilus]WJQ10099.1 efflux RND transporter permease subunit [Geobacillus stearothermophilus]